MPPSLPSIPPSASFTLSCTGLSYSFDGSGSAPGSASVAGYSWQFGDGASATGATSSHVYEGAGTFDVVLTVTDTAGSSGATTRSITLAPPLPTGRSECRAPTFLLAPIPTEARVTHTRWRRLAEWP